MTLHLGITPWRLNAPSAASIGEQAVFAEQHGYQSFWLPEITLVKARCLTL